LGKSNTETRTQEQIREHYEIEKALASRLRDSTKEERQTLYTLLYEELFQRVPHHQQLTGKKYENRRQDTINRQLAYLNKFLGRDDVFLEIGAGDCLLTFEVAKLVEKAYAIDVSETITENDAPPSNFELVISDGTNIPVPASSISFAYSFQLMEHLHPNDAIEQLCNVFSVISPGGMYLCVTPNRLNGPHDISAGFDDVATGFHLKEYSISELVILFRSVGFRNIYSVIGFGGRFFQCPLPIVLCVEKTVSLLPGKWAKKIAKMPLVRNVLYPRVIGRKPD